VSGGDEAGGGGPRPADHAPGDADRHFLRSAWTVSMLTMLSRVLGLARDKSTAYLLGAGAVNDALTWAWTVPNAFRRLFGEGALSSAFVPTYGRVLEHEGKERARQVSNEVISTLAVFLTLLSVALALLVTLAPAQLVAQWTGKDPAKIELTLHYTELLLPYLAFICVIAQFMGVMNTMGEFAVPAFASVILNLMWLAGAGAAAFLVGSAAGTPEALEALRARQGYVIVVAILVSGVVQLLWHLPRMRTLGVGFRLVAPRRTPELVAVVALTLPMLVGMGAQQLNLLADRTVAYGALGDGGTTHLYYGLRIMQFPQGLVTAALVSAVFPTLARLKARGDGGSVTATASLAVRVNTLLTLPAAAGLIVLARPIVGLLVEGGNFSAASGDATSRALVGYALGIPCAGMVMLLSRSCYAIGEVRAPVVAGLWCMVINIGLDLALVKPLAEFGLALATTLSTLVNAWLLLAAFRTRMGIRRGRPLITGVGPAVALTAAMSAVVWLVDHALAGRLRAGLPDEALRVAGGMAAGLAVYLGLAGRVCPDEWHEIRRLLPWGRRG